MTISKTTDLQILTRMFYFSFNNCGISLKYHLWRFKLVMLFIYNQLLLTLIAVLKMGYIRLHQIHRFYID